MFFIITSFLKNLAHFFKVKGIIVAEIFRDAEEETTHCKEIVYF